VRSIRGGGSCKETPTSPAPELLASLDTAELEGESQEQLRAEMLAFAHTNPDALLRTCEAGHFTGSALVVHPDREQLLLLLHAKAGLWLQPGGHADGEADLGNVALREATEETGIDWLVVRSPAIDLDIHVFRPKVGPLHTHLDVRYVVHSPSGEVPPGNHESEAIRWVTVDQLADFGVDGGLLRLARRGLAIIGG
jgi:8-oxo-dGTP pyrophosphatase MutT (NUDIX family)